jgi:archaellin
LAIVFAVIIIILSAVAFYYIVNRAVTTRPYPSIVDAVGTKVRSTDGTLNTVKFTVRNNGTGSLDLTQVSLAWQGPSAQTTLFMDKATYATSSKDTYGIGGSGSPADGWDPLIGKFLVKGGTVAWLVVNLTAQGGIGEPIGPGQSLRITLTIEGHGPGYGTSDSKTFKVPANLGTGLNVFLNEVK